jgi:plastocyanin
MRLETLTVAVTVLLTITSCSESTPPATSATTPPASTPLVPSVAQVSGRLAPGAIVVLAPGTASELPPSSAAVMDQVSLTFTPEIMFVRTGQSVDFRNSDDTLHNVHVGNTDTKEPSFNVAIPTGEVYKYTFTKDGFYHVSCDIHPSMSAEILAVSTPFAAVAGADGGFSFTDVPPGPYVLQVWASGVKTDRDVEIVGGANTLKF